MKRGQPVHQAELIHDGTVAEYWRLGDDVYRRTPGPIPYDVDGNPQDLRWECSIWHWTTYRTEIIGSYDAR
jgi:hypothetical protein